jgi:hypothetical protein
MGMKRNRLAAAAVALLVAVVLLAAAGYDHWIIVRHVDRGRLATLVVTTPPPGYTKKPVSANQVTTSSSPYSSYQNLVKHAPNRSGAYSVSWADPASSSDSATIMVSLLPTASGGSQVEAQAVSQFLGAGSFKAEKYSLSGPVPVTGVPGARGAVFVATGTSTTPPVAAVAFNTGRAQVLELVGQTGTPASTGATAAALAHTEYVHLAKVLPGFTLVVTEVPLVATAIYWATLAGVLLLALVVPLGVRRARRRRAEARRRTAHRQHQVRGSKIARRQAARRR